MAKRLGIKLDFSKFKGAFKCNIKGTKATKECLCIPLDCFYQGKNGALYLDFTAYESAANDWGNLYGVKQKFSKAEYDRLTEDEKRNLPFIGNIKAETYGEQPAPATSSQADSDTPEDMPF